MRYPIPDLAPRARHANTVEIEKSRFICWLCHAPDNAAFDVLLNDARSTYPDASHHCSAFIAGAPGEQIAIGFSDDGEPGGTAGRPMFQALEGSGLGQIGAVVTRYFGGTKLGTGGLVRAYTASAQAVLSEVSRAVKTTWQVVTLEVPYAYYEPCRAAIEAVGGGVDREEFAEKVSLEAHVPEEHVDDLDQAVRDLTSGRVSLDREGGFPVLDPPGGSPDHAG